MSPRVTGPDQRSWEHKRASLGAFIRSQRELANMSLRQLAQATQVSNAYLSQLERGLHDPTVRVLVQIGQALHLSLEDMMSQGKAANSTATGPDGSTLPVPAAINADPRLTTAEKAALLGVYHSYLQTHDDAIGESGVTDPGVTDPHDDAETDEGTDGVEGIDDTADVDGPAHSTARVGNA
ncbi:MAG: XRE family transcriptional regulator [Actinomycetales bacterium]|nr:MAG: XRE family transcriptional regulator [Actinomycetales bacterium]